MMGKARSVSQLRARMMDVLKEAQTSDFVSIFCARYNFDRLDDVEAVAVDYAMDLDCGVVYRLH